MMLRYRSRWRCRKFLDANGFLEIEPHGCYQGKPEGARDYLVPSRVHTVDDVLRAAEEHSSVQAAALMVAASTRYYQITKCFRDEDCEADRQPEVTQIRHRDPLLTRRDPHDVRGHDRAVPARRSASSCTAFTVDVKYAEAMHRYGSRQARLRVKARVTS